MAIDSYACRSETMPWWTRLPLRWTWLEIQSGRVVGRKGLFLDAHLLDLALGALLSDLTGKGGLT